MLVYYRKWRGKGDTAREDVSFGAKLLDKMVLLIKEALHHFQQELDIMTGRGSL